MHVTLFVVYQSQVSDRIEADERVESFSSEEFKKLLKVQLKLGHPVAIIVHILTCKACCI